MQSISVSFNTKQVDRWLTDLQKKEIPFATALALTNTAKDLAEIEKGKLDREIDRPTPFTRRGIRYQGATKRTLAASVYIAPIQYEYLQYQIAGGRRRKDSRKILIGTDALKRNRYGNLPRRRVAQLLARRDTFVDEINDTLGIWKRSRKGLQLLVAFKREAEYQQRYDYYGHARRHTPRLFEKNWRAALNRVVFK